MATARDKAGIYGVPESLGRSFLDIELAPLKSLDKRWSMRSLLFNVGSIFVLIWLVSQFLTGVPLWAAAVVVWWLYATWLLGRYDDTQRLTVQRLMPLIEWVTPGSREINTRTVADPSPFYNLVGIKSIDPSGTVHYLDRSVGMVFRVVGSASLMSFNEDREQILDAVAAFWRVQDESAQISFDTLREPQQVKRQVAALQDVYEAGKALGAHPVLRELLEEEFDMLTKHVGTKYASIHQYMTVKCRDANALRKAVNGVYESVGGDGSNSVLTNMEPLDRAQVVRYLSGIYKGLDLSEHAESLGERTSTQSPADRTMVGTAVVAR